jgi:hypothetical protein
VDFGGGLGEFGLAVTLGFLFVEDRAMFVGRTITDGRGVGSEPAFRYDARTIIARTAWLQLRLAAASPRRCPNAGEQ